jgi:hypothetical protein
MVVKNQIITKDYAIYNGDCIEVMKSLPENIIDYQFIVLLFVDYIIIQAMTKIYLIVMIMKVF